jgi:PEP-CTERM/exosortase A-associated glycosyltransferase
MNAAFTANGQLMRVLHIFDHSLPLQSGYVSRSLGILNGQRERGWQTIQLTSARHAAWTEQTSDVETLDGFTFHRTRPPKSHLPILREAAEMRALRQRLAELVCNESPDIIHAHSPVLNVLPAIAIARRFGLPLVYEVRAFWEDAAVENSGLRTTSLRYRATRLMDSWAMRRADVVLPICEPLRLEMLRRGVSAERLTVVPNAVDGRFLEPSPDDVADLRRSLGLDGRFVIGFIGSFYSYEGLDLLLEALGLLRSALPNLTLLLVGGGPEEERLRGLIAARALEPAVILTGRVKHDEVLRFYRLVDLFVFPRRRMRLTELVTPLKPLEAMAQKKPVAASNVGGHRELIRDGETGYLFPPDDVAGLAECLRAVIMAPSRRAAIADNGRKFVERERSWSAVVTRYAAVYEALLRRRGRTVSAEARPRVP